MDVSVEIQNGSGSTFEIQVDFWDTVLSIKEKIERSQRIPVSKQTLFFQGKLLQDDLDVVQCVITHNSRLHLFVSLDPNPNDNKDQVLQTDQVQSPSLDEWLNILDLPVKDVSIDDNNQVLQSRQPPLKPPEEFFGIQDSSLTVGIPTDNSQEFQFQFQTEQSQSALNSIGEFFNIQDSYLTVGRSNDSQVIQSEQSPPALNSTEEFFRSRVLHQTEQAPNSIGEGIIFGEDQPLTTEHISNIQNWPFTTDEITNYQDSQMMVRDNNNPVLQIQHSEPLKSSEQIINRQDLPVRIGRRNNNSQGIQQEQCLPSKSVKEIINISVMVLPFYRESNRSKIAVEVNKNDNVEELRKELVVMQQRSQLNLPEQGYFFIHKQRVLDEDKSFTSNRVAHGDTIEIFAGSTTPASTSHGFK